MTSIAVGAPGSEPSVFTAEDAAELGLLRMGGRPKLGRYISDLWARREFIWLIPRSEMRSRAMNTFLGSVWHLLNPLLLAGVYYFIFAVILHVDERDGIQNYPAYLIIGILVFYFTQKSLVGGARTVVNDVRLLQNVNFPAAVLPISATLAEALTHLWGLGAMFLVVVITGETPTLWWLMVIPVAMIQLVFNAGLAFISSRMTVHFRDTEQLLPYLTRIWLYLSGIMFGIERLSNPTYRAIFMANPPYTFIKVTRELIFEGRIEWGFLAGGVAWAVGIFAIGFIFFWANEGEYAGAA